MILNSIPSIPSITEARASEGIEVNREINPDPPTFIKLIEGLNNQVETSDKAIQNYILDQGISTHELMIALQNAKHSLQVAVEVRNKIVEAYNKVTRMSI